LQTHSDPPPQSLLETELLLGDRWTLLIIRDMMFFKKQRFEEFLVSSEGISTNILSQRLKQLEEMGLVTRQPYSSHSRRMHHTLTEQGEILRPVLKSMIVWGLRHLPETQIPDVSYNKLV
jgi:DNA-binding HxlR family transcriptional regulator